jgi:hypothetical protein
VCTLEWNKNVKNTNLELWFYVQRTSCHSGPFSKLKSNGFANLFELKYCQAIFLNAEKRPHAFVRKQSWICCVTAKANKHLASLFGMHSSEMHKLSLTWYSSRAARFSCCNIPKWGNIPNNHNITKRPYNIQYVLSIPRTIFCKNGVFNNFTIRIYKKNVVCILTIKRQFFRQLFWRNTLPNHNIGPRRDDTVQL